MSARATAAGFLIGILSSAAYFHSPVRQPAESHAVRSGAPAPAPASPEHGKPDSAAGTSAPLPEPSEKRASPSTDFALWEQLLEKYARQDLERLEKRIPLSQDQRERLYHFYLEHQRLSMLNVSGEEYDRRFAAIGTVGDIIGAAAEAEVTRKDAKESEDGTRAQNERHIALIARIAKLSDEERSELRDRLNSDDLGIEERVAYARQELGLSGVQEGQYRLLLHQYVFGDYPNGILSELEPYGGLDALPPADTYIDENGERNADQYTIGKFLVRMKMKPQISAEQFKRLEKLHESE